MKRSDESNTKVHLIQHSPKVKKYIFLALVCIFFLLIFILNRLFPLYSDDYLYLFIYKSDPSVPISSFNDIIHSQINHYMVWGGRSIVHGIAQFLLWIGTDWGDVLNSLAYILYILVIYKISIKEKIINPLLFIFIACILWIFLPVPIGTILWITGSANYLWGVLIILLFLYPYCSYYKTGKYKNNLLKCIFFLFFGIIAGWTNENLFIAQVFFIICLFFLLRKSEHKIPIWAVAGLIGVCIGGTIMLAAPGNFIRSEIINESLGLTNKSLIDNILYRVGKALYRYLIYIMPLVVVYLSVLFLYVKKTNSDKVNKSRVRISLLFFFSAHIAWIVMCVPAIFPPRATFGIITFLVVALGIIYADMRFEKKTYKMINIFGNMSLVFIFIMLYVIEYRYIQIISSVFKEREVYIEKQKLEGNKNIIFNDKIILPQRYYFEDLSDKPYAGYNKTYADYYGVDSVKVIK